MYVHNVQLCNIYIQNFTNIIAIIIIVTMQVKFQKISYL